MKEKKTSQKTKGQAIVEFALVLPILLLLIIGAVDIATMIYSYHRMLAACREGLKFAAESTMRNDEIRPIMENRARTVLTNSGIPQAGAPAAPTIGTGWISSGSGGATGDDTYNSIFMNISYTPRLYLGNLMKFFIPTFDPLLQTQWSIYRYSD